MTGHKAKREYREVGCGGVDYSCFAHCLSQRVLALLVRRELTSLVGWSGARDGETTPELEPALSPLWRRAQAKMQEGTGDEKACVAKYSPFRLAFMM